MPKPSKARFVKYGLLWPRTIDPIAIEWDMVREGGQWTDKKGNICGNGLAFHFRRFQELLWPEKVWHKWNILQMECYLKYRTIGVIGPASSGKTNTAATDVLADYFCFPDCTTVLCCSTTRERLEDRVWGEIKKWFKLAHDSCHWLAGNLIEGRLRVVTDDKTQASEGRDFRNGMIGVPCKKGNDFVGLGDFAGIKNKRVRLIGDEIHLLPRVWVDAVSNLDKNPDFKAVGLGNPKETTDALGVFCEPAAHLGGWDSGIDQTPGTKTWETRRPNGICIQLPGSDSPNLDGKLGIPLITQEQIDRDVAFYGKDSVWFWMMDEGRMPRGQGSRRVLTRQMCLKFRAMEEPVWQNSNRTAIAFLDAAYRGVGGDRCVFGVLLFGEESGGIEELNAGNLVTQKAPNTTGRKILALLETMVVPIVGGINDSPEDQIVQFVMNQCNSRSIPPENFFFDSGMRTSLVSAFSRIWSPTVESVDCGGTPSERNVSADINVACNKYYSKFITELWFNVRMLVEAAQFRGMTEDVMMEFAAREWTMVGSNKIEVESKPAMKLKTGRSPDLADAVAIGVYGAIRRGFVIARLKSENRRPASDEWKRKLRERADEIVQSKQLTYA